MDQTSRDSAELLKAALAMAAVDGRISGSERAVLKALARRAGVPGDELETMIRQAIAEPGRHDELFAGAVAEPERAMQLLVAAAQIDGRVSEEERNLLVDVSFALRVTAHRFNHIFQAGLTAANRIKAKPR